MGVYCLKMKKDGRESANVLDCREPTAPGCEAHGFYLPSDHDIYVKGNEAVILLTIVYFAAIAAAGAFFVLRQWRKSS